MNRIGRPLGRSPLLLAGMVAAFSLGASSARGGELTDHLTLLERLSAEAADEVLEQLQFAPGTTVHIVPEADHASNWLIIEALKERLLARGCLVVVPAFGETPGSAGTAATAGPPHPGQGGAGQAQGGGGAQALQQQAQLQQQQESTGEGSGQEGDEEEEGDQEGQVAPADSAGSGQAPANQTAGQPGSTPQGAAVQGVPATGSGQQSQGGGAPAAGAATASPFRVVLPNEGEVLSFRVIECGVSYPWARRTLLIGRRSYGRMACVRLRASRMTEPGHQVSGVASSDRVHLDSFPGWARPVLEGQNFPFPIQEPPATSARSILEPMVVAGIVGGLVYLFYANQK